MPTAMRKFAFLLVAGLAGTSIAQPAKPAPKKTSAKEPTPDSVVLGPDASTKLLYIASIDAPTATEGLAPADIAKKLRASVEAIETCYETAAKKHPDLAGVVDLKFRVAMTGTVANVSATGVAGASTCIAKVVARIKFPAPPQSVDVATTIKLQAVPHRPSFGSTKLDMDLSLLSEGSKAEVRLESFMISLGINTAKVLDVLEQQKPAFLACYKKVANRPPVGLGVTFRIEPNGAPSQIVVKDLPGVDDCVASAIKSLTFPKPTAKDIDVDGVIRFDRSVDIGDAISPSGSGVPPSNSASPPSKPAAPRSEVSVTSDRSIVSMREPEVIPDSLPAGTVRRYVKRNVGKLQHCYEEALTASPKLAGTVKVKFRIEANGAVSSASARGLAEVDTCIADVIRGIEFPKPKESVVDVTDVLTFKPVPVAPADG